MGRLIKESIIAGIIAVILSVLVVLIIHSVFAHSQDLGWTLRAVLFTSFFSGAVAWFYSARHNRRV